LAAPFAHRRHHSAVGVFHQFLCRPGIAEAGIHGDVGVDAEQAAEGEELIRSHIVRLHSVPDRIEDWRPFVDVADAVAPLVRRNEITTGKPVNAGMELFENLDDLCAKAFYVIGWH